MRTMLKSKIYGIKVTDASLHYEGSITIDATLLRDANIMQYEQVHVLNVTTGKRFITYALDGKVGEVCVNGAAAKLVNIGDELIILTYSIMGDGLQDSCYDGFSWVPRIINGQGVKNTAN